MTTALILVGAYIFIGLVATLLSGKYSKEIIQNLEEAVAQGLTKEQAEEVVCAWYFIQCMKWPKLLTK